MIYFVTIIIITSTKFIIACMRLGELITCIYNSYDYKSEHWNNLYCKCRLFHKRSGRLIELTRNGWGSVGGADCH